MPTAVRRGRARASARHPVPAWVLRAIGVAQLAMLLLFVAYFVSVQINAVAYLAGRHHAVVGGTAPPLPLDSAGAAVADIAAGLVCEAIAALVVCIAAALLQGAIREAIGRHRSRAEARAAAPRP